MSCSALSQCGVLAHALAVIFVYTPVSFQWDLTIVDGKCGDQIKLFQSLITTNIVTDAMIMLIAVYSKVRLFGLAQSGQGREKEY
jgi:hypothetical protein